MVGAAANRTQNSLKTDFQPMKTAFVTASLSRRGFGVKLALERLSSSLAARGEDVRVFGQWDEDWEAADHAAWTGAPATALTVRWPGKLGYMPGLAQALDRFRPDVVHVHGVWEMSHGVVRCWAARAGAPVVVSPHGMFGEAALAFSARRKRLFWRMVQAKSVRAAACLHATAPSEYEDIRAFGLRQPVAIVPNGIDLPDLADLGPDGNAPRPASPYVLSLGRIHPKKGLDRLVAAWALVAPTHPGWRLRIVGPDEGGHAEELKRMIDNLGLAGSAGVEPPVYGGDKFRLMRDAEIFALATLNENFAMTVAESLACETPVISTEGAPWSGLVDNRCGWWIDHGPEAMAAALREAMAMPDNERRAMGRRGRAWMQRDFGWDGIAERMIGVYSWLLSGADRPGWVWTD